VTGPPETLGPYAILETVEARAFTVTYRAEQQSLGRTVLLKTLKSTVSRESPFAAELSREAAVLGRLDHEGVIRLHDLVRAEGALYLVLEDARGVSLAEILRATRLELEPAVAVALAAARALGHAHERGVVHRAFGAAAVAVAPQGRVLLTDFSAAFAPAIDADAPRYEHSESLAQPSYMAPEQILGETLGPRADVWSLGVLLHELVTGARPFDGDDPRQLAPRIRSAAPAPLPSSTPPSIARIVARCLSKLPEDRYPDAGAVALALEEALAERTRLPVPVLASRALAAARLGEALPAPAGIAPAEPRVHAGGPDVWRAARALSLVLVALAAGGAAIRALVDGDEGGAADGVAESGPVAAGKRDRGLVRVVARPWAEVYLDGELVDVTPIGRPLSVSPGKHFVTFRHPRAPDEQRAIKIAAGQTVFLDVTLRVDRGDAGADHADGGDDAGSP
jgi:serine/threonine-protein kinase